MVLKRGDKGQRRGEHWHTTTIGILLLHFQHIWPEIPYKPLFLLPPLCWESFVRYGNKRYSQFLIILYNTPRLEVPLSMNLCCIDFKNMRSLIPSVLVENYIIPFEFSHFPGTLWPCQGRHPHPCISRSVRITQGFTCRGFEEQKGKRLHAVIASPST